MRSTLLLCVFLALCSSPYLGTNGARILGIFHPPAPSHFFCGDRLLTELAKRGHEVTMISSFPKTTPVKNYKDCALTGLKDKFTGFKANIFERTENNPISQILHVYNLVPMLTESMLNDTNVQKLLKSDEKFDLIIMEAFLNEAHLGFAYHYKAPVVILSTVGANPWVNQFVGNPAPSAYVSELLLSYSGKMSFMQRVKNSLVGTFMKVYSELYHLRMQNAMLQKYFPGAPEIHELFNEVAMILLNSHVSVSAPKPHLPSMVEIGGFHVNDVKELPKDLKQYLDSATEGFILFSMGSHLRSADLPTEIRDSLLAIFAKLPYKVLWKFEDPQLPGLSKNVRIEKWLPQNDILAHRNLKLFITHGGLLSTTEAVYHGVPIVGIPVMGDQKMNMANSEQLKIGKTVDFKNIQNTLNEAIQEVIKNPMYRQNVRARSMLMRDQPLKPIDSAVFWVEHVIRHKGAPHFKTGAIELSWYELYLLDVMAFLMGGVLLITGITYKLIKCVLCRKSKSKSKLDNKKKRN